jgi:hypothetical protein
VPSLLSPGYSRVRPSLVTRPPWKHQAVDMVVLNSGMCTTGVPSRAVFE